MIVRMMVTPWQLARQQSLYLVRTPDDDDLSSEMYAIFRSRVPEVPWAHGEELWKDIIFIPMMNFEYRLRSVFGQIRRAIQSPFVGVVIWVSMTQDHRITVEYIERIVLGKSPATLFDVIHGMLRTGSKSGMKRGVCNHANYLSFVKALDEMENVRIQEFADISFEDENLTQAVRRFTWILFRSSAYRFLVCQFGVKALYGMTNDTLISMRLSLLQFPLAYIHPFPVPFDSVFTIRYRMNEHLITRSVARCLYLVSQSEGLSCTPFDISKFNIPVQEFRGSFMASRESTESFQLVKSRILTRVMVGNRSLITYPALLFMASRLASEIGQHLCTSKIYEPLVIMHLCPGWNSTLGAAFYDTIDIMTKQRGLFFAPSATCAAQLSVILNHHVEVIPPNATTPVNRAPYMFFHRADWATEQQIACFLGTTRSDKEKLTFTGECDLNRMCAAPFSQSFLYHLLGSNLAKVKRVGFGENLPLYLPLGTEKIMNAPVIRYDMLEPYVKDFYRVSKSSRKMILVSTPYEKRLVNNIMHSDSYFESFTSGQRVYLRDQGDYGTIDEILPFGTPKPLNRLARCVGDLISKISIIYDFPMAGWNKNREDVVSMETTSMSTAYASLYSEFRECEMDHLLVLVTDETRDSDLNNLSTFVSKGATVDFLCLTADSLCNMKDGNESDDGLFKEAFKYMSSRRTALPSEIEAHLLRTYNY
jgi:hypothetical protein